MTDITDALAIANAEKVAHFQQVHDALTALHTLISSKPELWFGGNPPVLEEIAIYTTHARARVATTAGLDTDGE